MENYTYVVNEEEAEVFGQAWCGPKKFKHDESVLIAKYSEIDNDGREVEVYCVARPERFYLVKAMRGKTLSGRDLPYFSLRTGEVNPESAAWLAIMINSGMLDLHESER